MSTTAQMEEGLFDGGPCVAWQKVLRIIRSPRERNVARAVVAAILLGWVPIAVLATVEVLLGSSPARTFFNDVGAHTRFLIAVPLLILAEADLIPRLGRIVVHFVTSGLVREKDQARYYEIVSSTKRLLEGRSAYFITLILAYATVLALLTTLEHGETPAWYWAGPGPLHLSTPGIWHAAVSLPLLLWPCFGWIWRLLLWWRFLLLIARLDLYMIPVHPDKCAGLRFVGSSIRGFRFLALAIGSVVAASHINFMLRTGETELTFRNSAIGVAILFVVVAAGPLLMFTPKLRNTRFQGILRYGTLVQSVGTEFERQWLDDWKAMSADTLQVQDFSAMTDLNQVVENVYQLSDTPFIWQDLIPLAVWSAIPFLPVVMMTVPIGDLLLQAAKTLLL